MGMLELFKRDNSSLLDYVRKYEEMFDSLDRLFDNEFRTHLERVSEIMYPPMNVYTKKTDEGVEYKIVLKTGKLENKKGLTVSILDDTLKIEYEKVKEETDKKKDDELKDVVNDEWKPSIIEFKPETKKQIKQKRKWSRRLVIPNINEESVKVDYDEDKGLLIIDLVSGKRKKLKEIKLD